MTQKPMFFVLTLCIKQINLFFLITILTLGLTCQDPMANELKDIANQFRLRCPRNQDAMGGGSTDAASFGQQRIEATCLLAF